MFQQILAETKDLASMCFGFPSHFTERERERERERFTLDQRRRKKIIIK